MTDKEQIEIMARSCCGRTYKTCEECIKESEKIFGKTDIDDCECYSYAKSFFNKGYPKTIWHKLADNDLPQQAGFYLCYVHIVGYDRHNKLIDGYGYSVEFFDAGFCALNKSVIAWTELPTYKE